MPFRTFTVDEAHAVAAGGDRAGRPAGRGPRRPTEHRALGDDGALPELKGLEARLADLLDQIMALEVQLKGWAPLLVDIVVEHEGRQVLFCLLEGDREVRWYHEADHGFPGRRPLSHLGL